MKLSRELVDSLGPLAISLHAGGAILRADLKLHWKIDGDTLITEAHLSFKLPFREKMDFQIKGRDRIEPLDGVQLESFGFDDAKKFFGKWNHLPKDKKISYEDHRRKVEFQVDESLGPVIMSAGGILFCLLRMKEPKAEGVYVGADKIYQTQFLKTQKDSSSSRILISYFRAEAPKTKLVASIFVDSQTHNLIGGEIYLPVIGKLSFETTK